MRDTCEATSGIYSTVVGGWGAPQNYNVKKRVWLSASRFAGAPAHCQIEASGRENCDSDENAVKVKQSSSQAGHEATSVSEGASFPAHPPMSSSNLGTQMHGSTINPKPLSPKP